MRPIVRIIGRVLRLVGISSPEDSVIKPAAASDPPSWRKQNPPPTKPEDLKDGSKSR
jgi:hypothetical protein